jgi:hypothetical protein
MIHSIKTMVRKAPSVLENLEKAISSTPEWARPLLKDLPPAYKAAMAAALFDFSTKYVGEDKLDVKDNTRAAYDGFQRLWR